MQPVFRAAFTLGVSTWQPGCAHPTLHLQAFVCLSALPRPSAWPPGRPCPAFYPRWCSCCRHRSWWAVMRSGLRHPHPAQQWPEWKDLAPSPTLLGDLCREDPPLPWFRLLSPPWHPCQRTGNNDWAPWGLEGTCVKQDAGRGVLWKRLSHTVNADTRGWREPQERRPISAAPALTVLSPQRSPLIPTSTAWPCSGSHLESPPFSRPSGLVSSLVCCFLFPEGLPT